MKNLQYIGTFDMDILIPQLLETFPEWRTIEGNTVIDHFGCDYIDGVLTLNVPDNADELLIKQVLDMYDPSVGIYTPLNWEDIVLLRNKFMQLPDWSTWTPEEASTYIHDNILSGMTRTDLEAWVDTNVTNITTAKTALKLLGDEVIDLREICMKMAYSIMILRDVIIKRRIL